MPASSRRGRRGLLRFRYDGLRRVGRAARVLRILERWDVGCLAHVSLQKKRLHGCCAVGPRRRRRGLRVICIRRDTSIEGYILFWGRRRAWASRMLWERRTPTRPSTEITIDIEDVDEFMWGTEVEQTTYGWVASKPTPASKCMPASGLLVGDIICGVGTSTHLPHSSQELRDLLKKVSSRKLHVFRKSDAELDSPSSATIYRYHRA